MSYSDVMNMPVYERRFFLGLLTKDAVEKQERYENMEVNKQTNSKGQRTTTISGDQLKTKMNNGDIPTK
jgi:hypothetical protein